MTRLFLFNVLAYFYDPFFMFSFYVFLFLSIPAPLFLIHSLSGPTFAAVLAASLF
jgi:hypothetical protein